MISDFGKKTGCFSTVECLGSCGTAPVVMVNDTYHEAMSVEKLDARTIRLRSVQADGALYDVTLQWQPASQKFETIGITRAR